MMRKLLLLFVLSLALAYNSQAQTYLFFDNIAPNMISNEGYWNRIQEIDQFKDYFTKVPFSDATFGDYPNPDVVVIALFDKNLSYKPAGSSKSIIQKVQEWISQGVGVLIYGNAIIQGSGDPLVRDLLFDKLQMAPIGIRMLPYRSYLMQGTKDDPVGNGIRHYMNSDWTWVGNQGSPLAVTNGVEIFKIKDTTKAVATEHFWAAGQGGQFSDQEYIKAYTSDSLLGVRATIGESKVALWTVGLEVAAGTSTRLYNLTYAINWLVFKIDETAPVISVIDRKVNWGIVNSGDTVVKSASIQNVGKQDLVINKLEWALNKNNAFKLIGGFETPITIKSGEIHNIEIRFIAPGEELYTGWLTVYSNDPNTPEVDIVLTGSGGLSSGPILSTDQPNNILDFGDVQTLRTKFIDFNLKNVGDEMLTIQKVDTSDIYNDGIFTVLAGTSYPFDMQPGQSRPMKVRFEPRDTNTFYTGMIRILSNASNGQFDIYLNGKGVGKVLKPATIATDKANNTVNFGDVAAGSSYDNELYIRNTGDQTLTINSFDLSDIQGKGIFNIVEGGATPIDIAGSQNHIMKLKFTPLDSNVVYNGVIKVLSNASNGTLDVLLTGKGIGRLVSVEEYETSYLSLRVNPNPASDKAIVQFGNTLNRAVHATVRIIDMAGSSALLYEGMMDSGINLFNLDLSAYPSGSYVIVAETEAGLVKFKLNKN